MHCKQNGFDACNHTGPCKPMTPTTTSPEWEPVKAENIYEGDEPTEPWIDTFNEQFDGFLDEVCILGGTPNEDITLGFELIDFIRTVRAEAVEETRKSLGKQFLVILNKLSNSSVSTINRDINEYMQNIHHIIL